MAIKIKPPYEPMNKKLSKSQDAGQTRVLLEPEHQTKKQKWVTIGTYLALAFIALGVGLILFWSFQNENVLQINNEPFPVRTVRSDNEANGAVILKVDFCKNVETVGDVRTSFVGKDREIFLPLSKERGSKGCYVTEVPILIPDGTPPGRYKVRFRVVYDLNPLKRGIVDEFTSREFDIPPTVPKTQN